MTSIELTFFIIGTLFSIVLGIGILLYVINFIKELSELLRDFNYFEDRTRLRINDLSDRVFNLENSMRQKSVKKRH